MSRIIKSLMKQWLFHLGDVTNGHFLDIDDEEWRELDLPHDWSIEGQFKQFRDENWSQFQNLDYRIGYLPQGIGWYRKHVFIPESYKGDKIFIQFDGIYRNAQVWINGEFVGERPYGYSTFYLDLTPFVEYSKNNLIAVKVDNKGVSSRWYSGSGIYRKVQLIITNPIHIEQWGTYWTTPEINKNNAKLNLKTWILNESENQKPNEKLDKKISLLTEIYEKTNKMEIVSNKSIINLNDERNMVELEFVIPKPKLWSPDEPNLYEIKSTLVFNGKIIDEYWTPLGFRTFRFDPDNGFFLNDENLKFQGVCLHHDNGCLGSKVFRHSIARKLRILKEFGCNAIRTSHNPASQEMMELCDEMGFMVMDEIFDEWTMNKTPYGYWRHFDEWYEKDVRDFVWRDRNHPSVIIWSCGNEVPEQKAGEKGIEVLKKLLNVFHREDPTRPVTQGCNNMKQANESGFSNLLDIAGYNYYGDRIISQGTEMGFKCMYDEEHEKYPERIMIGSENVSAFLTRGHYDFNIVMARWAKKKEDFYCSAYDITSEISLMILKSRPYVCGMFTWEGFDYIGEPTPYPWPARSSYFGIVDLCGFPKDTFYLYQSQWTDKPMVHILPHWNWQKGMEIPVWVYSNCDSVELFLNGKSLGEKSFQDEDFDDILHLMWNVKFEPGELKAIAKRLGQEIVTKSIFTTNESYKVEVVSDLEKLETVDDICYLTVSIQDINNLIVPTAQNLVIFDLKGPGKIIGVGNGNQISHESFVDQQLHAFNGLCLAVLQRLEEDGDIEVSITSLGLKSKKIML